MKARFRVLDTVVWMHDLTKSLYCFEEHDVYLPIMVLEEPDNNKKGVEISRNARQAIAPLDEIVVAVARTASTQGSPLGRPVEETGRAAACSRQMHRGPSPPDLPMASRQPRSSDTTRSPAVPHLASVSTRAARVYPVSG